MGRKSCITDCQPYFLCMGRAGVYSAFAVFGSDELCVWAAFGMGWYLQQEEYFILCCSVKYRIAGIF